MLVSESNLSDVNTFKIQNDRKLYEVNSVFNPFEDQSVLTPAGLTVMYRRAHG